MFVYIIALAIIILHFDNKMRSILNSIEQRRNIIKIFVPLLSVTTFILSEVDTDLSMHQFFVLKRYSSLFFIMNNKLLPPIKLFESYYGGYIQLTL